MTLNQVQIGDIIRSCKTLDNFLVVAKSTISIFVVDLKSSDSPTIPKVLLLRDIDYFVRDSDIDKLEIWKKQMYRIP